MKVVQRMRQLPVWIQVITVVLWLLPLGTLWSAMFLAFSVRRERRVRFR